LVTLNNKIFKTHI